MADVNETQTARGSNGLSNPASASAAVLADPFNRKVESHLGDRVILKPLTRWNEAYKEFPRYVMEYLVSRYVDAEEPVAGQRKIDKILSEHYTESAKKELIKSRIKENGEYTLLGQLTVRLDQARDHYWADVPAPRNLTLRLPSHPRRLTRLALGGHEYLASGGNTLWSAPDQGLGQRSAAPLGLDMRHRTEYGRTARSGADNAV